MADTNITPGGTSLGLQALQSIIGMGYVPAVAALALAGVAPQLQQRTNTSIAPTVVAVSVAGVASSLTLRGGTTLALESIEGGVVSWPNLLNGQAGMASPPLRYRNAFFQVSGTFGAGGSVKLQGSNDGSTWNDLTPTAVTAAGFFAALGGSERPKYIRPNCTAGDGTTSLNVVAWFS